MKKLLLILTFVISLGFIGCSSEENVKNVPVEDIKSAINTESLLPIQPVGDVDAKNFYVFENVKESIQEGFVLQAMMNVHLQDVFVIKTNETEKIITAIEEYKNGDIFKMFADGYGGEGNIEAASNSILKSKGNYVYFIATPDADKVESKILEIIT